MALASQGSSRLISTRWTCDACGHEADGMVCARLTDLMAMDLLRLMVGLLVSDLTQPLRMLQGARGSSGAVLLLLLLD